MVVPEGKFIQGKLDVSRLKQNPVRNKLEGSKEAFNPSIFPRTMQHCALMANSEQPKAKVEESGCENSFIVRSDRLGFSISINSLDKDFEQGNRRLISQSFKAQAFSSSMINDAKDVASFLGRICDTREIHCPHQILGDRFWKAAFPLMAEVYDFGGMVMQNTSDIGFSDGDSLFGSEAPVKDVGYCPAAGFVGMGCLGSGVWKGWRRTRRGRRQGKAFPYK